MDTPTAVPIPKITALPAAAPAGEVLQQRSIELGALLVAITKLSVGPDSLTPESIVALNQLAVRLRGELDQMLTNAIKAGDITRDATVRAGD